MAGSDLRGKHRSLDVDSNGLVDIRFRDRVQRIGQDNTGNIHQYVDAAVLFNSLGYNALRVFDLGQITVHTVILRTGLIHQLAGLSHERLGQIAHHNRRTGLCQHHRNGLPHTSPSAGDRTDLIGKIKFHNISLRQDC